MPCWYLPADVEALQTALRRVLEDESLRSRFSKQNKGDVSFYNISSWVDRYEKCFEEVLAI